MNAFPGKTKFAHSEKPLRILWVKVGGLWPANSGGRLRSFHIISALSDRHSVSVLTTHGQGESGEALKAQLPLCTSVLSVPHAAPKQGTAGFVLALLRSWLSLLPVDLFKHRVPELLGEVKRALDSGNYDLCVADFLTAMPNVPDGKVPVVFFAHNVEYMIWRRLRDEETNPLRRMLLEIEWRKMRYYESQACERAALTLAVSEDDRRQFFDDSHSHGAASHSRITSIPTGVDTRYFQPMSRCHGTDRDYRAHKLVFTGSMDWHPNEDAMLYFLRDVLPRIREVIPDVTLSIVGRNPGPRIRLCAEAAGVQVTGTVADIRPFVEQADVYIVPLRIGGGTRLKIFEALAMGKPVVSTTIGAEGLPLVEGKHILRADDPARFASAVISLLDDRARCKRLGAAGRQLVEDNFSWTKIAEQFEAQCRTVGSAPSKQKLFSIKGEKQ